MLRLRRARSILAADQPFYGLVSLRLELTEDTTCETVWCNGVQLGFNPMFVRQCTELELKAVVTKMALHAALGHTWRCEKRDLKVWNEACDYAVAPIIVEAACRLPGKFRSEPKYDGWCAEAIYRALKLEQQEQPEPQAAGSDAAEGGAGGEGGESDEGEGADEQGDESWRDRPVGEIRPAPVGCDQEAKETEFHLAAQQGAMAHGTLPGSLGIALTQSGRARVNWKEVLWQFAQTAFKATDYSWSRPNARYMAHGLYLPRLQGRQTPPMTAAVDVSGSIVADPELVKAFVNELDGINSQAEPAQLDVLYVDTVVQAHERYQPGDTLEPKTLPGGGGTDFRPAFRWVDEQGDEPCCLAYLTDLLGTFPDKDPGYPVLWVVPDLTGKYLANPPSVPFGEVVVLPAFD